MPWSGTGTYVLPPAFSPEVNGTVIDATRYNGLTTDVATGITAAIAKNGENTPTANLPMGGFKHTGAAVANASGQYLTYGQAAPFTLSAGTEALPSLTFTGDPNTGMWWAGADILAWSTGGVERFRVTNSNFLLNQTAAYTITGFTANNVQAAGTTGAAGLSLSSWLVGNSGPDLQMFHSRNAAVGSHTIVQDDDILGQIVAGGSDGVAFQPASRIRFEVDGTPGVGDMPGRISFWVTPDGSATLGEAARITNAGDLLINNTTLSGVKLIVDRLGGSTLPASVTTGTVAAFLGNLAAGSPAYVTLVSGNTGSTGVNFADTDADSRGWIRYDHNTDGLSLATAGVSRQTIGSTGAVTITAPTSALNTLAVDQFAGSVNAIVTSVSLSGGSAAWGLGNSSNTASSNARISISVAGTSAGDPTLGFIVAGTNTFSLGIDNSDSDLFKISSGATLGTTDRLTLSTTGNFTLNAPSTGDTLTVIPASGFFAVAASAGISGASVPVLIENTSNTGNSHAGMFINVGGSSGGDAFVIFEINSTPTWIVGLDNSDSDGFKLSAGGTLGTGDTFGAQTDGRLWAGNIHNNGTVTGTTKQYFASGTYTPTGTATSNVDAVTPGISNWFRIGNQVRVDGLAAINATAAGGVTTIVGLSLPIASAFTLVTQLSGQAVLDGAISPTNSPASIKADVANDRAQLTYQCTGSTASVDWQFGFTYEVL